MEISHQQYWDLTPKIKTTALITNKPDNNGSNYAVYNLEIVSLETFKQIKYARVWVCVLLDWTVLLWYSVKTKCIVRPQTMEMLTSFDTFCSSFPWWLPHVRFHGGNTCHTSISIKPFVFGTLGKQLPVGLCKQGCLSLYRTIYTVCVIQSSEPKAHSDVTTALFVLLCRIRHNM